MLICSEGILAPRETDEWERKSELEKAPRIEEFFRESEGQMKRKAYKEMLLRNIISTGMMWVLSTRF